MRKYTRPTYVKAEEIDNINETIFMFGSGDIWVKSTCFIVDPPVALQGPGIDGLSYYVYQISCEHDSSAFTDLHHNKGQNYVFTFNYALPEGTIIKTNGAQPGIINDDRVRVLFTRHDTAEVVDDIEYDDFEVHFDFTKTSLSPAEQNALMLAIRCTAVGVNDFWLRTENPSLQGG